VISEDCGEEKAPIAIRAMLRIEKGKRIGYNTYEK
jgi:hypothetical protein